MTELNVNWLIDLFNQFTAFTFIWLLTMVNYLSISVNNMVNFQIIIFIIIIQSYINKLVNGLKVYLGHFYSCIILYFDMIKIYI